MASGKRWTRGELLVTVNLYHKLNFGQFHSKHPVIVELAEKLGRSSSSVAMKLCNFASLDPVLKLRGIKGLAGASVLDRTVWTDFHDDPNEVIPTSEELLRDLFTTPDGSELEVIPKTGIRVRKRPPGELTEISVTVKQRRGQEYFRDAVLNNFGGCCGVTGLSVRELLIASHILPWKSHAEERLNVRNGLSLSRLHDAAFDRGLITFDSTLCLILSPILKSELTQRSIAENFGAYEGASLKLPEEGLPPESSFMEQHRKRIFKRK